MNEDYEIKVDGEKAQFESGANRNTKKGKGRFDLLDSDIMAEILEYSVNRYSEYQRPSTTPCDAIKSALLGDYVEAIRCIISLEYFRYISTEIDYTEAEFFVQMYAFMMKDLAIHYEKGADMYGENNWKKGIPTSSFRSSGLRHLTQWLRDETDEPHHISAIWNFIGCIYNSKHGLD